MLLYCFEDSGRWFAYDNLPQAELNNINNCEIMKFSSEFCGVCYDTY